MVNPLDSLDLFRGREAESGADSRRCLVAHRSCLKALLQIEMGFSKKMSNDS